MNTDEIKNTKREQAKKRSEDRKNLIDANKKVKDKCHLPKMRLFTKTPEHKSLEELSGTVAPKKENY